MATKKVTKKVASTKSTKAVTTAKAAPQKTAAATTKKAPVVKSETVVKTRSSKNKFALPDNLINIITAEAVGTFVLTLVAILSTAYFMLPFYVGLTLTLMVMAIGIISGSHINPAVTFGLWSMRKVKTAVVPFYWVAQFLGAMAAVVMIGAFSKNGFALHFDHFFTFSWSIFALELVGAAVFLFGLAAVISRSDLNAFGKAFGIGMSLTIALVATSSIMPHIQRAAFTEYQESQQSESIEAGADNTTGQYPHDNYVTGATLNPAVALAVTESTDSQLQGSQSVVDGEKTYTRLSAEVILGTLIGAALGGNLFLLINYRAKAA